MIRCQHADKRRLGCFYEASRNDKCTVSLQARWQKFSAFKSRYKTSNTGLHQSVCLTMLDLSVSKLATNLKDGPNIGCKISTSILCENALFSVINAHILLQCWMLIKGFLKGLPWTGAKMACFRWHINWRINKINKNYF